MSDQLLEFDEVEHDRTGGPPPPFPKWDYPSCGVPLQEQCEDAEEQSNLLGVALDRAIDVIEALLKYRSERANDVYQAQLDAQDWQNRYNELARNWEGRTYDEAQIRELVGLLQTQDAHTMRLFKRNEELIWQNEQLEVKLEEKSKDCRELLAKSQHQVVYQMPDNLLLELEDLRARNDRQSKMIEYAQRGLSGYFYAADEED